MRIITLFILTSFFALSAEAINTSDFPADLQDILNRRSDELAASGGIFIAGKVTMSDGVLITGGKDVQVNLRYNSEDSFRVYREGWFMLDRILPSKSEAKGKLFLRAFGYHPIDAPIPALNKGELTYVQFVMNRVPDKDLATVTGVVVNDQNEPVAGAKVSLSFPFANHGKSNTPYKTYMTGKDGRFSFSGLSATEHKLVASASGYSLHSIQFTPDVGLSEKMLKLFPKRSVILDYVFQSNGSRNFSDGDLCKGTIEWTAEEGGVDFSDAEPNGAAPYSRSDIEMIQTQNSLAFLIFYFNGPNGFYDAGTMDFGSVTKASEDGYSSTKPTLYHGSYLCCSNL